MWFPAVLAICGGVNFLWYDDPLFELAFHTGGVKVEEGVVGTLGNDIGERQSLPG